MAVAPLPPVVLVHGIFRDSRHMRHLAAALRKTGRRVLAPDLHSCDGSASLPSLAKQLGDFIESHLAPGERCDLAGHSMGGIVCRSYIQRHGGYERVRRLVTLASPHKGTVLAWLWPGHGARDLRPGSKFLRDLNKDSHGLSAVNIVSVWTPFDFVIVPPRSSHITVGKSMRMKLPHHAALVNSPRSAKALCALLNDPDED